MKDYNWIIKNYAVYEKSDEMDRMWETFIIPENMMGEFANNCKDWLKSTPKANLSISWNNYYKGYECILSVI